VSEASPLGFVFVGCPPRPFTKTQRGYRFAKLACHLVDKHGFIGSRAKVYLTAGITAPWTQPIGTPIDFMRATFRAAIEAGDLTYACFSMDHCITYFLLRNDPLDVVGREAEKSLHFVRKARFQDVAAVIVSNASSQPCRDGLRLLHFRRRAVRRGNVQSATGAELHANSRLPLLDRKLGALSTTTGGARISLKARPAGHQPSISSGSTTFITR
jgi:hypothetical protein